MFEPGVDLKLTDAEVFAWDMYYSSMMGWAFHPGNYAKDKNFAEYAAMADAMIEQRRLRSRG